MTRLTWSMREEERSCCGRNASGSDVVANRLDERLDKLTAWLPYENYSPMTPTKIDSPRPMTRNNKNKRNPHVPSSYQHITLITPLSILPTY
eukprot:scaffold54682_cov69-Cyclotella_meneghiniana.AAC.3